jgi:hypothetical protein
MSDTDLKDAPPKDGSSLRAIIALGALTCGVFSLGGLFFVDVPVGNKEPLLIAIGIILGWGSTVINYEFGSSPAGRKAADAGIKDTQPPGGGVL